MGAEGGIKHGAIFHFVMRRKANGKAH